MVQLLSAVSVVVYVGGLLVAAGWDLASYTIPNRVVAAVAGAAGLALMVAAPTPAVLLQYAATAAGVLVVGAMLFSLGLWGGGDAKLLAAVAMATGYAGLSVLIAWTAVIGGILAGILLLLRHLPFFKKAGVKPWCAHLFAQNAGVPYGVAIAAAGILAFIDHRTVLTAGLLSP